MKVLDLKGQLFLPIPNTVNACRIESAQMEGLLCDLHSDTRCSLVSTDACRKTIYLKDTPENRAIYVLHKLEDTS